MRSWFPIPAHRLDNKRLRGEHNELLIMGRSIFKIIKGWRNHPETKRWVGHSVVMKARHDEVAAEMVRRGMNHQSPWPEELVIKTETELPGLIEPIEIMLKKLREKQNEQK